MPRPTGDLAAALTERAVAAALDALPVAESAFSMAKAPDGSDMLIIYAGSSGGTRSIALAFPPSAAVALAEDLHAAIDSLPFITALVKETLAAGKERRAQTAERRRREASERPEPSYPTYHECTCIRCTEARRRG